MAFDVGDWKNCFEVKHVRAAVECLFNIKVKEYTGVKMLPYVRQHEIESSRLELVMILSKQIFFMLLTVIVWLHLFSMIGNWMEVGTEEYSRAKCCTIFH